MTIALLYLLGRMPEEDEKAYEIHLLECRACLAQAEAVERTLQLLMKDLRRTEGEGVVIPFHSAKAGLWAAQRELMQTSGPLQQLASQMVEVLDGAERDLKAIETALKT